MTATERLYERLETHWAERLVESEEARVEAAKNLAQLSLIYSGQLQFDFVEAAG